MYKQYTLRNGGTDTTIGGSSAEHWSGVWRDLKFSSERQVATLARTPQWKAIQKVVQPGWKILEAGCGLGSWVRFFASQGMNPVGLDYSVETIERLRSEFPSLTWRVGDIRDLPIEDESFDALVSWGVIEHFEEGPEAALAELTRVLRPNGYAFLTVPWLSEFRLRHGYSNGGDNLAQFSPEDDVEFAQYFMTKHELIDFVEGAGMFPQVVLPSSIHAKSLIPPRFRARFPMGTKFFDRIVSPILPKDVIASMILVVARKFDY